jgi:hypothetical protein
MTDNLFHILKKAILEGKLDTELGITNNDVCQRFDIVAKLLNAPCYKNEVPGAKTFTPHDVKDQDISAWRKAYDDYWRNPRVILNGGVC